MASNRYGVKVVIVYSSRHTLIDTTMEQLMRLLSFF